MARVRRAWSFGTGSDAKCLSDNDASANNVTMAQPVSSNALTKFFFLRETLLQFGRAPSTPRLDRHFVVGKTELCQVGDNGDWLIRTQQYSGQAPFGIDNEQ